jgi:RimJ/RimL family protein N-acetyltransferase/glycosyltransferase involved in cell wall biosynthesis
MYKVIIRPLKFSDSSTSYLWRNDTEVWKFTGNKPNLLVTEELERKWISEKLLEKNSKRFAIEVDDEYVGNVQLTEITNRGAEFHIFIGNKDYWGKGISYIAILQLLRYAKRNLSLEKIDLKVNPENKSAINLYKKVGFEIINDLVNMEFQLDKEVLPRVSVFCMVYNHEKFLSQCLDGFLMQKCNFDFEIVVGEDCSTDKSREILLNYANKYPGKFKLILHDKNVGAIENQRIVFENCTGKYIAMCEGDDYWTDPLKLQKQVDFLGNNPDFSFVCGDAKTYDQNSGEYQLNLPTDSKIITKENFCYPYLIKTCTILFDSNIIKSIPFKRFNFFKDITLFSFLLKTGNGYYEPIPLGVYRIHEGGVWSMKSSQENEIANLNSFLEIYYFIFKTNQIKKYLINMEIKSNRILGLLFENRLMLLWCYARLLRRIKLLITNLKQY